MNAGQWYAELYAERDIPHAMTFVPRKPHWRRMAKKSAPKIIDTAYQHIAKRGEVTFRQLAEDLGISIKTAGTCLFRLERTGKLVRRGDRRHYVYSVAA